MQAGLLTTIVLPVSLFIIMFGMGLSLLVADFSNVLKQPKAAILGVTAQLVALPVIAFVLAVAFKLPPELAVGLMIISFAPGGATSNMFTNLAKGDGAFPHFCTHRFVTFAFQSKLFSLHIQLGTYNSKKHVIFYNYKSQRIR